MDRFITSKLRLVTVEPVSFFYLMITYLEAGAMQELIFVKCCIMLNHPENFTECSYDLKQNMTDAVIQDATNWSKYTSMCVFFFIFISSFYVGSWSDRFGRKLPMLVPPIGTALSSTVNALLSYFFTTHVAYFLISAVISGITFGIVGILASTYGHISDITDEQSRTKRIIILDAMIVSGAMAGTYLSGAFLRRMNFDAVLNNYVHLFIFEAFVAVLVVAYILWRIPSPDVSSLGGELTFSGLFSLRHIRDFLLTVFRPREGGKRKKILLMLVVSFFIYIGTAVQFNLGYYFVKAQLQWPFEKYTSFNSILLGVKGFALIIFLPIFVHLCHASDYFMVALGLVSGTVGFVVFGLSTGDYMVYSCAAIFLFSEFPDPVLRSMLSKTVDADEKGKIFAFTTILMNFCFLLGSSTLMTVFNLSSFHGLCFEVCAVLQGTAFLILVYLYLTRTDETRSYEKIEN